MSDALSVEGLTVSFRTERGVLRAVDDVSFSVPKGTTMGLVGESGCGKSVTSLAVMRLLAENARIEKGAVRLGDRDLATLDERAMRGLRGSKIAMIFQEPMTSLNPVYTVGSQIVEAIRLHQKSSRKEAWARAVEMLALVGIPDPGARADAYPHELSGGMRQRVMIAMALALEPDVLVADEPTTALDVTIQAQILDLLAKLQAKMGMSIVLITHDLGIVAEAASEVVVMYAGQVVERAAVADLFAHAAHPYTKGLLRSIPPLGSARRKGDDGAKKRRLPTIEGVVPSLSELPPGCRFRARCDRAVDKCVEPPPLEDVGNGHLSRCHFAREVMAS